MEKAIQNVYNIHRIKNINKRLPVITVGIRQDAGADRCRERV
ncbi:hypothetical protein P4H70_24950 [Paenibacillus ehimensis]|nr:hypothetical protein [Paenibacillus ehimensis]MEC0212197.1 hypothetical protein [Paenibacillus ehimensis]